MNQGDYIVLAIDLNQYVLESSEVKALQNLDLYEAIIDLHYFAGLASTYQRGQVPIDQLYLLGSLTITSGGY